MSPERVSTLGWFVVAIAVVTMVVAMVIPGEKRPQREQAEATRLRAATQTSTQQPQSRVLIRTTKATVGVRSNPIKVPPGFCASWGPDHPYSDDDFLSFVDGKPYAGGSPNVKQLQFQSTLDREVPITYTLFPMPCNWP